MPTGILFSCHPDIESYYGANQGISLEKAAVPAYYGFMHISLHSAFRVALFLFFAILLVPFATFSVPRLLSYPPDRPGCDAPIPYRVEASDPRFPLDAAAFRRGALEAETLWEKNIGKDLFTYDPDAGLVVRTEFDERQKMTYEADSLEKKVSEYRTSSEQLGKRYNELSDRYKRENRAFADAAEAFNRKLAEYNRDVNDWNQSGSGTAEEYDALEKRRKKLEKEEASLVQTSKDLNELSTTINGLVKTLNRNATEINRNIDLFRKRYGEPKPFVQGLYDPSIPSVTVFEFKDADDLRLVLAHEFGHALGIEEHVENESSVMFAMMGGQDLEHPTLSKEDIDAYGLACPPRNFSKRELLARYLVLTPSEEMSVFDVAGILLGERAKTD